MSELSGGRPYLLEMDHDDAILIAEYAQARSELAFSTLVQRHLNLVFSAAMRQLRDRGLAEEASQRVFLLLATKASSLRREQVLAGWLYRTAGLVASEIRRREQRRHNREQLAMETLYDSQASNEWKQIAPVLDDAMAALSEADRNAILLRFFENKPFRSVGDALGVSEDTAQKRVSRALERMRGWFGRRGVSVSTTALAAVISGSAVQLAPQGLAAAISTAAATTAASAGAMSLGFIGEKIMHLLNLKTGLALGGAAAAATALVVQQNEIGTLRHHNRELSTQYAVLQQSAPTPQDVIAVQGYDLNRLKRDAAEVHRLRGEVAQLRRERDEAARLRAEVQQLKAQLQKFSQQAQKAEDLAPEQALEQATGLAKMNHAKYWTLAFVLYADKNDGFLPATFQQAELFYPKDQDQGQAGLHSALVQGEWEILYKGKLADIPNPVSTIVIREKQARASARGGWVRAYGFADGHSEYHREPNGDFERWENARIARAGQ